MKSGKCCTFFMFFSSHLIPGSILSKGDDMPSFLQSESESVADNQWGASVAEARPPIGQQLMQFSFSSLLMQLRQRLQNRILDHVPPTKKKFVTFKIFCVSCIIWQKSCGYFKTNWNTSYNLKVCSFVLCSNQFVHSSLPLHKCKNTPEFEIFVQQRELDLVVK